MEVAWLWTALWYCYLIWLTDHHTNSSLCALTSFRCPLTLFYQWWWWWRWWWRCAMTPLPHQTKARFSQPFPTNSCLHFRGDVTDEKSHRIPVCVTGDLIRHFTLGRLFTASGLFLLWLLLCVLLCLRLLSFSWNERAQASPNNLRRRSFMW